MFPPGPLGLGHSSSSSHGVPRATAAGRAALGKRLSTVGVRGQALVRACHVVAVRTLASLHAPSGGHPFEMAPCKLQITLGAACRPHSRSCKSAESGCMQSSCRTGYRANPPTSVSPFEAPSDSLRPARVWRKRDIGVLSDPSRRVAGSLGARPYFWTITVWALTGEYSGKRS